MGLIYSFRVVLKPASPVLYSRKSEYTEKAASTGPYLYSSVMICCWWDGTLYVRLPEEGDTENSNIKGRNKTRHDRKATAGRDKNGSF